MYIYTKYRYVYIDVLHYEKCITLKLNLSEVSFPIYIDSNRMIHFDLFNYSELNI